MDKLTAIKIKYDDGTYSDEIPVSVLSENVEWDNTHTLVDVLGNIDINTTGTVQDQISRLFNEKVSSSEYNNLVNRVNNLIALPDGATKADAELVDIRLKTNGVVAATAGNAVREQITELKNKINESSKNIVSLNTDLLKYTTWESGTVNSTTGENVPWATRIRTGYIPIDLFGAKTIIASVDSGYKYQIFLIDFEKSSVVHEYAQELDPRVINLSDYPTACYVRFVLQTTTNTAPESGEHMHVTYTSRITDIIDKKPSANSLVNEILMFDTGRILLPNWGYYNLDRNGDLVNYPDGTRMATPDYYTAPYNISIASHMTGVAIILCLYNADFTLKSRAVGLTVAQIAKGEIFRIGTISESTQLAKGDVYNSVYCESDIVSKLSSSDTRYLIGCFHKFVGIGDSLMAGFTSIGSHMVNSQTAKEQKNNWFDYMLNKINREGTNLAVGSSTIHNWRYADQSGLPSDIENANIETDCYLFGLGVNDLIQSLTIGTANDIDETTIANCADSVYGNLYYCLSRLKTFNPYAKIFVFTIPKYADYDTTAINAAITAVCNMLANVYPIEIPASKIDTPFFNSNFTNGHYNPISYNMFASIVETEIG